MYVIEKFGPALGLVTGLAILYTIGRLVYRVFFHPLSKFPGPWYLGTTAFWYMYRSKIRGDWHIYLGRLHEKYGPVVRVTPDRLSMDGSIGWKPIFGHTRGDEVEFHKDPAFFETLSYDNNSNMVSADYAAHRRQRKLIAHAFSDSALAGQEPLIMKYTDLFVTQLRNFADTGTPLDIVRWYNYLTFDIIGELAFGESFHCLETSNLHPWVEMIANGFKGMAIIVFLFEYPLLHLLVNLFIGGAMVRMRNEHLRLAEEKVKKRIDQGIGNGTDFMSHILRHNDEKGMSNDEIIGNSDSFIAAGSETTATALSGLTYYVCQNPKVYKRLVEEIRGAFVKEEDITMRAVAGLQYLTGVIEETLRLYPPAVDTPPRVSPGKYINGYYLPKGTIVACSHTASGRNPNNFTNPDAFLPERWLRPEHPLYDTTYAGDIKTAVNAFSYGPRNCVGKNLAWSEMRLAVCRVFWNFDVEMVQGQEGWIEQKVHLVWDKTDLNVKLTHVAREHS